MTARFLLALVATLTAPIFGAGGTAGAQRAPETAPPVQLQSRAGSKVTVRGTTTIGADWSCTATDVAATALLSGATGTVNLRELRGVTVEVPVAALRCQNRPMERAMRGALEANREDARAIVGRFTELHIEGVSGRTHLDGMLRVAGRERRVALCANIEPRADGTFLVRSTLPLTMSQFEITPPRVLLGAVRARDAFSVEVELVFRATSTIADSATPKR